MKEEIKTRIQECEIALLEIQDKEFKKHYKGYEIGEFKRDLNGYGEKSIIVAEVIRHNKYCEICQEKKEIVLYLKQSNQAVGFCLDCLRNEDWVKEIYLPVK